MGYIYCITNLINGKRYVGKTTLTIEERFKEHCQDSKRERCNKRPLYDAFLKYGIENFKIEELELVENDSLLNDKEIYWIKELLTYGSNGYNASKGGDGKILYDYKEILELINLGYTSQLVSEKIGCCKDIIRKVAKAHNVKIRSGNSKLIAQYDLAGNYILTFYGAMEALTWLLDHGLTTSKRANTSISKCCIGKMKTAFNYIWKYLPEPT